MNNPELAGDPIRLRIWGPHACFTRPELKAERHTYDVITPSAARGILEAIYWNPGMRWRIDRIWVERPVRYMSVRRNEVKNTLSAKYAEAARKRGSTYGVATLADDDRQQRHATILRDVSYVIEGRILQRAQTNAVSQLEKHQAVFRRRSRKGQCFHQPYFGVREFPVSFEPADKPTTFHEGLAGEHRLGWMLYDINFGAQNSPVFFEAVMRNGLIDLTECGVDGSLR